MISLKKSSGYLRKKGRNTGGFTLVEMLVVVLLIGLLGTVTAAGIPAVRQSYRNVKMRANAQTLFVHIYLTDNGYFPECRFINN